MLYLTFIINTNSKKQVFIEAHESYWNIGLPLILLACGSLFIGYIIREMMLSNTIFPIIGGLVKTLPLLLSIFGALLAFQVYDYYSLKYKVYNTKDILKNRSLRGMILGGYYIIYTFLNSAWQYNYIINNFIVFNVLNFAHLITYRVIDRGILEIIGPKGISDILIRLTQNISSLQSGMVFNYVLVMIVFVVLLISGYGYF